MGFGATGLQLECILFRLAERREDGSVRGATNAVPDAMAHASCLKPAAGYDG